MTYEDVSYFSRHKFNLACLQGSTANPLFLKYSTILNTFFWESGFITRTFQHFCCCQEAQCDTCMAVTVDNVFHLVSFSWEIYYIGVIWRKFGYKSIFLFSFLIVLLFPHSIGYRWSNLHMVSPRRFYKNSTKVCA